MSAFSQSRFTNVGPVQRVRLRLSRAGVATANSHLKQIELLRRALIETSWPVARSQAKRPVPKISFGPAISVGYASTSEYCDVQLTSRLVLADAPQQLRETLPAGYSFIKVKSIPVFFPSLEQVVNAAEYEIHSNRFLNNQDKWTHFVNASTFPVVKKKKDREEVIDARSLVKEWKMENDILRIILRFGPKRTLKPERILQAIDGWTDEETDVSSPQSVLSVTRTRLYLEKENGELLEP